MIPAKTCNIPSSTETILEWVTNYGQDLELNFHDGNSTVQSKNTVSTFLITYKLLSFTLEDS